MLVIAGGDSDLRTAHHYRRLKRQGRRRIRNSSVTSFTEQLTWWALRLAAAAARRPLQALTDWQPLCNQSTLRTAYISRAPGAQTLSNHGLSSERAGRFSVELFGLVCDRPFVRVVAAPRRRAAAAHSYSSRHLRGSDGPGINTPADRSLISSRRALLYQYLVILRFEVFWGTPTRCPSL